MMSVTTQKKQTPGTAERARGHDTFIIESVDSIDTCTLVIATKNEKVFGVFNLVGEEKTYRFKRLFPPIHVIAEEEVVCLGRESTVLE
jgi:hypothetical protein